MATTKSAGRVSIRVLPDSTGFRSDLKKSLDRIEKTLKVKIPVEPVVDKAAMMKIKKELESLIIKLKPTIDLHISPAQIEELKAKIESMKPEVNVDLDTAEAAARMEALTRTRDVIVRANVATSTFSARLAALTRPRSMTIIPTLSEAALVRIRAKLLALGGLHVLGDTFREGSDFLMNIDRMSVKLGKLATLIGGVASSLTTTVANLLTLGSGLLDIGNLAWLAPGFLTGGAIAIGVTVAALKDMKTVLKDLGPRFQAFQDSISSSFWAEAEKPIRDLVDNVLPRLYAMPGHQNTAQEMGKFFGEIADSIRRNLPPGLLEGMFDRLNEAIGISRGAIDPFIHAFITVGNVGTQFFKRFATWIVDLATQLDDFVTKAAADGRLVKWINEGIDAVKDFASLIGGTWRIFAALTDAARQSGAKSLHDWAQAFHDVADAMERPEFKKPLVAFFKAMRDGTDGIIQGLKNIGPGLSSMLTNALPGIMADFKTIFSTLGTYIGEILGNKQFQTGLGDFIRGIKEGLLELGPAITPLANSLGGVGTLLGHVAKAVGQLLSDVMVKWGPVLDKLGKKFETLIDPISQALRDAVTNLTPLLSSISTDLLSPIIDTIRSGLIPLIATLSSKLPALKPLIKDIGDIFKDGVAPFVESINNTLGKIKTKDLDGLFSSLGDLLKTLVLPVLKDINGELDKVDAPGLSQGIKNLTDIIKGITGLITFIMNTWGMITDFVDGIGNAIQWGFKGEDVEDSKRNSEKLKGIWNGFVGWLGDIRKELDKEFAAIGDFFKNPSWGKFTDWWDSSGAGAMFDDMGKKAAKGLKEGWDGFWKSLDIFKGFRDSWDKFYGWLKSTVPDFLKKIFGNPFKDLDTKAPDYKIFGSGGGTGMVRVEKEKSALKSLQDSWNSFWIGLQANWDMFSTTFSTNWTGFWGGIGTGWTTFWAGVGTTWNGFWAGVGENWAMFSTTFGEGWNTFWTGVGQFANDTWTNVQTWISTKASEIGQGILTFGEGVKTNWDLFWGGVGTTVTTKWEEFKTTISTKAAEIGLGISTFGEGVKTNWTTFWGEVGTTLGLKWEEFKTTISTKGQEIQTGIATFGEAVKVNWSTFWGEVGTTLQTKWEEFKTTVSTKAESIKTNVSSFAQDVKTNWNTFWGEVGTTLQTKWDQMKGTVSSKGQDIKTNVSSFGTDIKNNWNTFWGGVGSFLSTKWDQMKNTVSTKSGQMKSSISTFVQNAQSNLSSGWGNMRANADSGWAQISGAVSVGVSKVVTWVAGLPGRALGAIGETWFTLQGSGANLIGGFISGMESMINAAAGTASAIMSRIRAFFPFSPAKEGPFSGRGYTTHSGRALVKDFAGGMMDNMNLVRDSSKKLTEAAKFGESLDLAADLGDQGVTIDRRSIDMRVYNPVAEPTSRTIETASNRMTMRKK